MERFSLFGAIAIVCIAGCGVAGCGVEQYRQRLPAHDLAIRMIASDGAQDAEVLPRLSGSTDEMLIVERAVVVDADHIRTVRLLDAADGARVIVLDLDDAGRARLEEASRANVGRRMAIVAGGRVIAAPTIRNPLTESEAFVSVPAESLEAAFDAVGRTP